jgi:hypothetical protein
VYVSKAVKETNWFIVSLKILDLQIRIGNNCTKDLQQRCHLIKLYVLLQLISYIIFKYIYKHVQFRWTYYLDIRFFASGA